MTSKHEKMYGRAHGQLSKHIALGTQEYWRAIKNLKVLQEDGNDLSVLRKHLLGSSQEMMCAQRAALDLCFTMYDCPVDIPAIAFCENVSQADISYDMPSEYRSQTYEGFIDVPMHRESPKKVSHEKYQHADFLSEDVWDIVHRLMQEDGYYNVLWEVSSFAGFLGAQVARFAQYADACDPAELTEYMIQFKSTWGIFLGLFYASNVFFTDMATVSVTEKPASVFAIEKQQETA